LMLLPHWTDGCIGSSEGLFFEASGTTPYHFITAAAMSTNSSNPVRQLRYTDGNPAVGVPFMQELGIRYYMAWTDQAVAKADLQPDLVPIKTSGPWHIYEVTNSEIVTPLKVQPVVVGGRADNREKWLELGTSWFQNPQDWVAVPSSGGPKAWQRVDAVVDPTRVQANRVDVVVPDQTIQRVDLPPVTVANVKMGNETVDFDVDQVGVPVLVKVSYFPNWEVSGGEGPYRIAPNLMVVIPTSNHVSMEFGRSSIDYIAYVLSLLGIILLFVFKRFVPIRHRSPDPFDPYPAPLMAPVGGTDTDTSFGASTGAYSSYSSAPYTSGQADWTPTHAEPSDAHSTDGDPTDADWTPADPLLVPPGARADVETSQVPRDGSTDVPPSVDSAVGHAHEAREDAGPGAMLDDPEPPR
jgi:hypothetical protein